MSTSTSTAARPIPCLACNEHVKFRALLDRALALDADYLATGHYARVVQDGDSFQLHRAIDDAKDQSYVLYTLAEKDLRTLLFPVGGFAKPEIRRLAQEMRLELADKPDSAEICFVPNNDYRTFLADRIEQQPGAIVDSTGSVVGEHGGIAGYTIGQRKGIGAFGGKRFVTDIDPELNVITIGDDEDLLASSLTADKPTWVAGSPPADEFGRRSSLRCATRARPAPAIIRVRGDVIEVELKQPLRAVTPGQAAVIYDGDRVLGGGVIARTKSLSQDRKITAGILPNNVTVA